MDMQAIVMDIGSGIGKYGFSGDDKPKFIFPTICGRRRNPGIMVGMDNSDKPPVGYDAVSTYRGRGIVRVKYPVEHGIVKDFDNFEKILHYSYFYKLRVTPEEHPTVILESPFSDTNEREKKAEMLFETFNVPCFSLMSQAVGSLCVDGDLTGCVLEIGDGVCHSMAIYGGRVLPKTKQRSKYLSGREITDYYVKILTEKGYDFTTTEERKIISDVKERLSFVSQDFEKDIKTSENTSELERDYELPDGSIITVGCERFRCTEYLFEPHVSSTFVGVKNVMGIHELIGESLKFIEKKDIQSLMYKNIVLSGGSTKFIGLEDRLEDELGKNQKERHERREIRVGRSKREDRHILPWIGASIASSSSTFNWVKKEEYDEDGESSIIHRRCPIDWDESNERRLCSHDGDLEERGRFVIDVFSKSCKKVFNVRFGHDSIDVPLCLMML